MSLSKSFSNNRNDCEQKQIKLCAKSSIEDILSTTTGRQLEVRKVFPQFGTDDFWAKTTDSDGKSSTKISNSNSGCSGTCTLHAADQVGLQSRLAQHRSTVRHQRAQTVESKDALAHVRRMQVLAQQNEDKILCPKKCHKHRTLRFDCFWSFSNSKKHQTKKEGKKSTNRREARSTPCETDGGKWKA